MEFTIPTTRENMFKILDELFHYYRISRPVYSGVSLDVLYLQKLNYSASSQRQLEESAELLVKPAQDREIADRKRAIDEEIKKLTLLKSGVEDKYAALVDKTETLYDESKKKIEHQVFNNGIVSSGMFAEKLTTLETEKNDKILELSLQKTQEESMIDAQLAVQYEALNECEEYFVTAHKDDVNKKVEELRLEELKTEHEVFKYNNSVEEKIQRYKNTVKQINANLELKFLSISTGEYTKDQLIEMGYYEDVLKCVCGYYNTLPALTAYQDLSNDTKLPIYLDHYYENILSMYQSKAGL